MMLLSKIEGNVSRSERKRSACIKVLNFTIWNVFFVNVFSGSFIEQVSVFSKLQELPFQLAKQMPDQAAFFTTYVLSSGWASLACELIQLYNLVYNFILKFILRSKEEPTNMALTFPHHTEIPRMLLFGLLGFTFAILAPLILPFLLIYFSLAFLVYRNQLLHVYVTRYESAGLFWPVVHNTTIFSLVLTQVIAVAVFALKLSPVVSGATIPLIVFSLLFNEYCRKRFSQVFRRNPAQVLIEMDRRDEQMGREEGFYNQLRSEYCQLAYITRDLTISQDFSRAGPNRQHEDEVENSLKQERHLPWWAEWALSNSLTRKRIFHGLTKKTHGINNDKKSRLSSSPNRPKATVPGAPRHLQVTWSVGPTNSADRSCAKPWSAAAEDHATCRTRGQTGPEGPRHLQGARWRGPSGPARPRALQVARSTAAAPLGSAHSS
ncbi:hypothetical protein V6N13_075912 [Hibiscus sabdariffa]